MKVAIRVDASPEIGTGHVRRCLALADALDRCGADVRFVHRDLGVDVGGMLPAVYGGLLLARPDRASAALPGEGPPHAAWAMVSQQIDAADTLAAIAGFDPDWIVVDHYSFDRCWHDAVRIGSGARLCVIDDLADRSIAADLVVDHNFHPDHREKFAGRLEGRPFLLAGPNFALLGPAFERAIRLEIDTAVPSIGIFMGGIDVHGAALMVLDAVDASGFDGAIEIVTTGASPALAAIERRIAGCSRIRLSRDLPDLTAFFARHQLQIGAGGGATWERCCIGAPSILLSIADNQQAVIPCLAEQGVVLAVPERGGRPDPQELAGIIRHAVDNPALRVDLSNAARRLVDGRGAMRVALAMGGARLRVRDATMSNAGLMLEWRNHADIRSSSRNQQVIDTGTHARWTERMLTDRRHRLLIGEVGAIPVGVIRFDALTDDCCEVSLYLDPALRGLGLGDRLLAAGEAAAFPGRDIFAEVLEENRGSAQMFLRGGYEPVGQQRFLKRRSSPAQRTDI
ncbi:MAG: UDP-2,4-diacetamido-2,4,6-trideoxy-beta-L-altropyranose hydrolase [Pseudomonadota bacterium]